MQINGALNLVFPIGLDGNGAPTIWAYHAPISADVFRSNYRIIAAAKVELYKGADLKSRLQYAAENGPVIGKMVLLDVAARDAAEQETESVGPALLAEMNRLTTILAPTANGYEQMPLDIAVSKGVISESELDEVESTIVFFTCGYAMSRERGKSWIAETLARSMMGSTTSSAPMEFVKSLKTSTPAETSEPTPQ